MTNGNFIASILFLLVGLLLLPPISEQVKQKFAFWQSKNVRYIGYSALFVVAILFDKSDLPETTNTNPVVEIEKQETEIIAPKSVGMKGIVPADIYPNFEDKGFKIVKEISTDGSFFHCDKEEAGIKYNVKIYCEKNVNDITTIRVTAYRSQANLNTVDDMKPFLKYGASIPYDGANIEKVKSFIDENYNNDKANVIISGVKFTIFCPTEFTRMIEIENE